MAQDSVRMCGQFLLFEGEGEGGVSWLRTRFECVASFFVCFVGEGMGEGGGQPGEGGGSGPLLTRDRRRDRQRDRRHDAA